MIRPEVAGQVVDSNNLLNVSSEIGGRHSDSSQLTVISSVNKKTPPGSSVGSASGGGPPTAPAPTNFNQLHMSPSPQVTLKSQLRNRPKSFAQKFRPNSRLAGMAMGGHSYLESPLHEQQDSFIVTASAHLEKIPEEQPTIQCWKTMYQLLELYSQMPETKTVSRQSITPIFDSQPGQGGGAGGGGGGNPGGGGGGILMKTGRKIVRDLELGDYVGATTAAHHHSSSGGGGVGEVESIPLQQAFSRSGPLAKLFYVCFSLTKK